MLRIIDGRGSDTTRPRASSLFFFPKNFFQEKFCVYEMRLCRGIASYHHHYTLALIYFIVINNYSSFSLLTYQTPSLSGCLSVSAG